MTGGKPKETNKRNDHTDTDTQGPRVRCTMKRSVGLGCGTDEWRDTDCQPRCHRRVEERGLTESGERRDWMLFWNTPLFASYRNAGYI